MPSGGCPHQNLLSIQPRVKSHLNPDFEVELAPTAPCHMPMPSLQVTHPCKVLLLCTSASAQHAPLPLSHCNSFYYPSNLSSSVVKTSVCTNQCFVWGRNIMDSYASLSGCSLCSFEYIGIMIIINSLIIVFNYVVITLESPVVQVRIHLWRNDITKDIGKCCDQETNILNIWSVWKQGLLSAWP